MYSFVTSSLEKNIYVFKETQKKVGGLKKSRGASLVAQWLRIRLPMQGTRVRALVRKIPHAAEQLSPCAATTEAGVPRGRALQRTTKSSLCSPQLEKAPRSNEDPTQPK